jgi:hypothetical protein
MVIIIPKWRGLFVKQETQQTCLIFQIRTTCNHFEKEPIYVNNTHQSLSLHIMGLRRRTEEHECIRL